MKKILIILLLIVVTIKISTAQGGGYSSGVGYPTTAMITSGITTYYRNTTQGGNAPKWYALNPSGDVWISRDSLVFVGITSGTATLVAGTVTVAVTTLTANSKIMLTHRTPTGAVGVLSAPFASRIAGTSFIINSVSAGLLSVLVTDTSTIDWIIVN